MVKDTGGRDPSHSGPEEGHLQGLCHPRDPLPIVGRGRQAREELYLRDRAEVWGVRQRTIRSQPVHRAEAAPLLRTVKAGKAERGEEHDGARQAPRVAAGPAVLRAGGA